MTGFSDPVTAVQITGDSSVAVSNPGDIGLSTAQQANALGIPPNFVGKIVANVNVPTGATSYTLSQDMTAYGALSINLYQLGQPQLITFTWLDAPGGNVVKVCKYLATGNFLAGAVAVGAALQVTLPVEAPTLTIQFSQAASTSGIWGTRLVVYASNRLHAEVIGSADPSVSCLKTQAWSTSTPFYMGTITTKGGAHWARMLSSSSGSAYFGYQSCDSLNNLSYVYLFRSAVGQDAYQQIILPRGCIALYVLAAVTATYTIEYDVTPTS